MKSIETIVEKQRIAYEVLCAFDDFCTANNLRYSLGGGTMLGAIRHRGFIPWDDDVDVLMPRPDYDLFFALADDKLEKTYRVVNWQNMPYPYIGYGKMYDTRTKIYSHSKVYTSNDMGIFIDIFPIDGLPDDAKLIKAKFKKLRHYKKMIMYRVMRYGRGKNRKRTILKFLALTYARLFVNLTHCVKAIDTIARQHPFETSTLCAAQTLNYEEKEIMPREEFTRYVRVQFCDRTFPVFENYDQYLKQLFGNYMELPPVEQRHSHSYDAYWNDNDGTVTQ